MDLKKLVEVECLKHTYPDSTSVEFCGLDFVVNRGEAVAVIGRNGSGKSTLLKHLLGFLSPSKGSVRVMGQSPGKADLGRHIGFVLQNIEDQLIGPTLFDEIAFTARNFGFDRSTIKRRVQELLYQLDLQQESDKLIHYLSGGQKKKVALAAALVHQPALLVLDEPLSELDQSGKKRALKLLKDYQKESQAALVMSTNEINFLDFFDTIYLLEAGQIKLSGPPDEFTANLTEADLCHHN